jgi:hypothetical protein
MRWLTAALAGLLLLSGLPVHAALIVGNINQTPQAGLHAGYRNWRATSFTLDSTYTVETITLAMDSDLSSGSQQPAVQIRNDSGDSPGGTVLAAMSVPTLVQDAGDPLPNVVLTAPANTTLSQDTYWLVVYSSSTSESLLVRTTTSDNEDASDFPGSTSIIGNSSQNSSDGGATWYDGGTNAMSMSIQGTPEPSSLVLIGLGAAGFLSYRWRRRRKMAS